MATLPSSLVSLAISGQRSALWIERNGTRCTPAALSLRSWLHCVEAEIRCRNGDAKTALTRIQLAEDALTIRVPEPEWLDFYNESRLMGFTGYAELAAGEHERAAEAFETSLATLSPRTTKQQSVLLLDLATAWGPTDGEHAVKLAGEAIDSLQRDFYATAEERLPAVRASLREARHLAELDERIAAVV